MAQDPDLLRHASRMRREATPFEIILWRHLSRSQLGGFKFRRQHVLDGRIFDFFCPEKNIAVEIDGDTHDSALDRALDQQLAKRGITTIRFNKDVRDNLEGLLSALLMELNAAPTRWAHPHPNPSPEGEGLESSPST